MDSHLFGEKSLELNCKIGKLCITLIQKMKNRKFLTVFGQLWGKNTAKIVKNNTYIEKE